MVREDATASATSILRAMSPDELRRALAAVPHVTAALAAGGPIAGYFDTRGSAAPLSIERLAAHLVHSAARRLTIQMLPQAAMNLLSAALLLGGSLDERDLAQETADLAPADRELLIEMLVDRLLVRRRDGGIALLPGIDTMLGHAGRSIRSLLLVQSVTKDDVAAMLLAHGQRDVPSGKEQRLVALARLLSDTRHIEWVRAVMRDDLRDMFEAILAGGAAGVSPSSIGVDTWYLRVHDRMPTRQVPPTLDALMRLDDLGLIWVEPMADRVGVWIEVVRGAQGRLITRWELPATPALAAVDGDEHALPAVFSTLHGLLDRLAVEPIPGLKTGDIGVKAIRDVAKRLGRPEPELRLLLDLLRVMGVVRRYDEILGSGRAASYEHRFGIDAAKADQLREEGTTGVWRRLVTTWLSGADTAEDRFHHMSVRFQVLHDLLALPEGRGIPADRFTGWWCAQHWVAATGNAGQLLTELRILGLVPADGPVGLTAVGRALVTDDERLAELIPATTRQFLVQADHTVIAPPTLDPEVRSTLERLTTVRSVGSATVHQLDAAKIGAHLADGATAASILEFLTTGSSVPLAPSIERLLTDLERQRGGLAVRGASTVVTADDVLALATAVKVRAAQLTSLAPTVAISPLPPAKVAAALRAKGLAPSVATTSTSERSDMGILSVGPGRHAAAAGPTAARDRRRGERRPLVAGAIGDAGITRVIEAIDDAEGMRRRAATKRSAKPRGSSRSAG